jgi:hypothetical protein
MGLEPKWNHYEYYVFGTLQRLYPAANIRRNIRLMGKKSRALRQIDVLVQFNVFGIEVPCWKASIPTVPMIA